MHDPYFNQMLNDSDFRRLAESLLEDEVVPKNAQFLCKPPRIGQATPPHQDGYYFMIEPVEGLTMWLGLDYADEENGCLRYVRGSHKKGLREHGRTQTLGFSQGITDFGTPLTTSPTNPSTRPPPAISWLTMPSRSTAPTPTAPWTAPAAPSASCISQAEPGSARRSWPSIARNWQPISPPMTVSSVSSAGSLPTALLHSRTQKNPPVPVRLNSHSFDVDISPPRPWPLLLCDRTTSQCASATTEPY